MNTLYVYILYIIYELFLFLFQLYNWLRLLWKNFITIDELSTLSRRNALVYECIVMSIMLEEWLIFLRICTILQRKPMSFIFDICFNYSIVRNSDWVFFYKKLVSAQGMKYYTNNKYMTWQNDIKNMTYIMDIFG